MSASSNIRAFVQWKESTVFAGEDISCVITFRNIAPVPTRDLAPADAPRLNGSASAGAHSLKSAPLRSNGRPSLSRNASAGFQKSQAAGRGHKPSLSLNVAASSSYGNGAAQLGQSQTPTVRPGHKHGRSLSIVSLGNDGSLEGSTTPRTANPVTRPTRHHGRSASVQIIPRASNEGASAGYFGSRAVTQPSPRRSNPATPMIPETYGEHSSSSQSSRRSPALQSTPSTHSSTRTSRQPSLSMSQSFRFPMASAPRKSPSPDPAIAPDSAWSPQTTPLPFRTQSPRSTEHFSRTLRPEAKVLSGASMQGTPRSSGELYSVSNHSSETLASEYTPQMSGRLLSIGGPRPSHQQAPAPRGPETLMMGYAHVAGTFTLDGSLVNQAPFEEVKRKAIVGGHGGGGVVGVESTKRESGLFGSLSWGSIGESLGGLLSSGEPSSIREMRCIANSKAIPLISTPQSILFVDLRLEPGESRSYNFSFTLPRGLPPTYKGRAMKVSYRLIIGTQRPGMASDQQVKQVDVPFRVVGSVSSNGDILGHDLMSPYIILKDLSRTSTISSNAKAPEKVERKPTPNQISNASDGSLPDFLSYVNNLLNRPRENSSMGLLSPTDTGVRRQSMFEEPRTMKETIDLAILRSNLTNASNQSTNRFEIARSGRRVAVVTLTRPAYRLGEVVTGAIDFTGADIPCHAVAAALESAEKVDPTLALRSAASIQRVTRKTHASVAETALFAARIPFALPVPAHSTPEFVTTGVSLEWKLRVEFVTPPVRADDVVGRAEAGRARLLEEALRDDRGVVRVAVEDLACESFEVAVPIRVYGAVIPGVGESADVEGLVV